MAEKFDFSIGGLKVALVHDSLTVPGGAEKVLFELHKLFPNAPIFTPLFKPQNFPEFKDADIRVSVLNRFWYARNHHQVMIPFLPYFIEQFDLSQFDLVISDSSAVAKGVITRPETLHICYCHTPMRWAWLPHLDKRASSSWLRRLAAHYLRMWDSASSQRVDIFFANSNTTAGRIRKYYRREAMTIYPPVDTENIHASITSDDFYLTVGRLIPDSNKRTDLIITAAVKSGIKLKVIGSGPMLGELKRLARGSTNIEFLGYVNDQTRNQLYSRCKGLIFASEEDAGIVPVEAMAHGKPVLAYAKGGASESVINNKTGLLFSDATVDSLLLAIEEFKELKFDTSEITKHAQKFSSQRFRDQIMIELTKQVEIWNKLQYREKKDLS